MNNTPQEKFRSLTKYEGYFIRRDGAHGSRMREPLTLELKYPIQWRESRVNLAELAKLRYLEGWDRKKLAQHYGRTLNSITIYCQNIRRKDFNLEGLTAEEKEQIRWAYQN